MRVLVVGLCALIACSSPMDALFELEEDMYDVVADAADLDRGADALKAWLVANADEIREVQRDAARERGSDVSKTTRVNWTYRLHVASERLKRLDPNATWWKHERLAALFQWFTNPTGPVP